MNVLVLQLKALRAACVATVAGIDTMLELMEHTPAPAPAPETPAPAEEDKAFNPDAALCEHPRSHWVRAPAMGKPDRMLCRCGEEMEDSQ